MASRFCAILHGTPLPAHIFFRAYRGGMPGVGIVPLVAGSPRSSGRHNRVSADEGSDRHFLNGFTVTVSRNPIYELPVCYNISVSVRCGTVCGEKESLRAGGLPAWAVAELASASQLTLAERPEMPRGRRRTTSAIDDWHHAASSGFLDINNLSDLGEVYGSDRHVHRE